MFVKTQAHDFLAQSDSPSWMADLAVDFKFFDAMDDEVATWNEAEHDETSQTTLTKVLNGKQQSRQMPVKLMDLTAMIQELQAQNENAGNLIVQLKSVDVGTWTGNDAGVGSVEKVFSIYTYNMIVIDFEWYCILHNKMFKEVKYMYSSHCSLDRVRKLVRDITQQRDKPVHNYFFSHDHKSVDELCVTCI